MNTIWKGIEKIYNFHVKGLAKIGIQKPQNAIDLLLSKVYNCCWINKTKSRSPGENEFDTIPSRKKMFVPPLLAQPLDELRQQQVQGGQDNREAALRKTDRETRVVSRLFLFIEKT
jgi:hypothetical protein